MFLEEAGRTDAFPDRGSGFICECRQGRLATYHIDRSTHTHTRTHLFPLDQAPCRVPGYVTLRNAKSRLLHHL